MYFEDEYGGYYTEPSIADEIIDGAVDALKEHVIETAKSALDEYRDAESKKDVIFQEITEARYELEKIHKDIERAKNELIKEKRDMPNKYISEFIHEATGNLAPGDKVYVVKGQYEKCAFCNGEKQVLATIPGIEDTIKVDCPKCKGYGRIYRKRTIVEEDEVKEVRLKLCFEKGRVNYWNTDCIYLYRGGDFATQVENIYLTREEAEAALEQEVNNDDHTNTDTACP